MSGYIIYFQFPTESKDINLLFFDFSLHILRDFLKNFKSSIIQNTSELIYIFYFSQNNIIIFPSFQRKKSMVFSSYQSLPVSRLIMFLISFAAIFSIGYSTSCQNGVNGCTTCTNSTRCSNCNSSYYLNSSYQCAACPVACKTCTSSIKCTSCLVNSVMISNICQCLSGLGFDQISRSCIPCLSENCLDCALDYRYCTYCTQLKGVDLAVYKCFPCMDTRCVECPTDHKLCYGCVSGYGPDVSYSYCIPCIQQHCTYCNSSAFICSGCQLGYGVSQNYRCAPCADSKCINCANSTTKCLECISGYNNVGGYCVLCTIQSCIKCPQALNICQACMDGYGMLLGSNKCVPCSDTRCLQCSQNYLTCTSCLNTTIAYGYGLNKISSTCQLCADSLCTNCNLNISQCTFCVSGYVPNDNAECVICSSLRPNCIVCATEPLRCATCQDGYGRSNQQCARCNETTLCLKCQANPGLCQYCIDGYGVLNGQCVSCILSAHCISCANTNATYCTACSEGYGVNAGVCVPCNNTDCNSCSKSYLVCDRCIDGLGFKNNVCMPCMDSSCVSCGADYSVCTWCKAGFSTSGASCERCRDGSCVDCFLNVSICIQCLSGFGVTPYSTCQACIDPKCDSCSLNSSICTNCIIGFRVTEGSSCQSCLEPRCNSCPMNSSICTNCSVGYGVSPSSTCQACLDPKCTYCPMNSSICTNCSSGLGVSPTSICQRCLDPRCTSCSLKSFVCTSCSSGFGVSSNWTCVGCYDFRCALCSQNASICIQCFSGLGISPYSSCQSPDQAELLLLGLSYTITIFSWATVAAGVFFQKLGGIEGLFLIQFSWIFVLSSNQSLQPLKLLWPLKYAIGLDLHTDSSSNNSRRLLQQPEQPEQTLNQFFSNNFNLFFIILAIPLIFVIITYIRLRLFLRSNPHIIFTHQETETEEQSHLLKLTKHYSFSLQFLMYCTLFNLTYFFACSGMFFIADGIKDAMSIIMLLIGTVFFVAVFIQFYRNPQSFGFFCFSFKEQKLAKYHYFIYTVVLITIILLMTLLPSLPYLSLIPCSAMLIFTLLTHPYRETKENYRSAFNLLVMISFIIFKVYLTFCAPQNINGPTTYALAILNILILLPIVIILSLVSTVYYWYNEKYVKPKQDENYEKEQQEIEKERLEKVLKKMGLLGDKQSTMNKISNEHENNQKNDQEGTFNSFKGKNLFRQGRTQIGTMSLATKAEKIDKNKEHQIQFISSEQSLKEQNNDKSANKWPLTRYMNQSSFKLSKFGDKNKNKSDKKFQNNDKKNRDRLAFEDIHNNMK